VGAHRGTVSSSSIRASVHSRRGNVRKRRDSSRKANVRKASVRKASTRRDNDRRDSTATANAHVRSKDIGHKGNMRKATDAVRRPRRRRRSRRNRRPTTEPPKRRGLIEATAATRRRTSKASFVSGSLGAMSSSRRTLPRSVVHADWSMHPKKRWASHARLVDGVRYAVDAPALVTPAQLLSLLLEPGVLAGFDFPIGIPSAYARRVGAHSFVEWLPGLGRDPYVAFFEVARTRDEIALHRPFYPQGTRDVKRQHLVDGLGLTSPAELFRRCDVAQGRRACPLFWTLGGNQVGKAALTGWREVLQPAVAAGAAIWPFDGALDDLLARGGAIIVESYPGDVYGYVGATLPRVHADDGTLERGKRSRRSRRESAEGIVRWAHGADLDLDLSAQLVAQLRDGFGEDGAGEDRFDTVIGLLGMLAVLGGSRGHGAPDDDEVILREGWILGRGA
jgi:hypothetical protein